MSITADLHVHSIYSDGRNKPRELLAYAKKIGIDIIALTDHDTSKGVMEFRKNEIIPGQEVSTEAGHVVILCEFPPEISKRDLEYIIEYSKLNNCVIFPSHPYDRFRKGLGDLILKYKFDAIEVYNPKAPKGANERALRICNQLKLSPLSNSDAHIMEALGAGYNIIESSELKVEEILESIRKGRIKNIMNGLSVKAKIKILEWYIERKIASNIPKTLRRV